MLTPGELSDALRPPPVARTSSLAGMRARLLVLALFALAVLALALPPRLADLAAFSTPDEQTWMGRSRRFEQALTRGDLADTYQSGHPGVTTMWLTIATSRATELVQPWRAPILAGEDSGGAVASARVGFGLVASLGLVVMVLLAWRVWGGVVAMLAAILLAWDPLLIAHARVVQLDSLVTTFMGIAVLAGVVRWHAGGGWGYLLLAGLASGLAALTKAPAAVLIAGLPLIALLGEMPEGQGGWQGRLAPRLRDLLLVAAVAGVVAFALWPALLVEPVDTFRRMVQFQVETGGSPHENGNYFMGRPVEDPGPLFYPVAFAFRATPLLCLGLLAALGRIAARRPGRRPLLALLLFGLLFGLAMTAGAKKFDRYLLPAFPPLDVAAAVGLAGVAGLLPGALGRRQLAAPVLAIAGLGLQGAAGLPLHPYYLAYYNPLVGGPEVAPRVLLVGWGEGLDQVVRALNARPDAEGLVVTSWYGADYSRYFRGRMVDLAGGTSVSFDYHVFYISQYQRGVFPESTNRCLQAGPELIVRINGIEYAWMCRGNRPDPSQMAVARPANFGEVLQLEGYTLLASRAKPGEALKVVLFWRLLRPTDVDYQGFSHLVDAKGERVAQRDLRLGGRVMPTSHWPIGDISPQIYEIEIKPGTPPGSYSLLVGAYQLETGQRLELVGEPGNAVRIDGLTVDPS